MAKVKVVKDDKYYEEHPAERRPGETTEEYMTRKTNKLNNIQKQANVERTVKQAEEMQRTGAPKEDIQKQVEANLGKPPAKEPTTIPANTENKDLNLGKNMEKIEEKSVEEKPVKKEPEKKYGKSMYGILDAVKNGDIDKGTAAYFMLDALSKTSRNIGRDIGNIGAQYTGGAIDNNYDQSLWNERRENMFENEQTSELNQQKDTDKNLEYQGAKLDLAAKKFANQSTEYKLNASKMFDEKAKELAETNPRLANMYSLLAAAATSDIGMESYIAAWLSEQPESEAVENRKVLQEVLSSYSK